MDFGFENLNIGECHINCWEADCLGHDGHAIPLPLDS